MAFEKRNGKAPLNTMKNRQANANSPLKPEATELFLVDILGVDIAYYIQ